MSTETTRLIGDGQKGGRGYGGRGRGRLYTYCYTVTTRMTSALRWAAMRAILMFHNCKGQSFKTVSIDHNFWRERRAEADLNQGPSAYQPNALLLGQTGSRLSSGTICFLYSACMRQHKTCHFSFFFTTLRVNQGGRVVRSSAGKIINTALWV